LAFDPDYATNGYFYVFYSATNPRRSFVSRFSVTEDPLVADPNSELVILEIVLPVDEVREHYAGQLAFGPQDGYLYVSVGDGGALPSGGVVTEHSGSGDGQDLANLLGKILRIDVSGVSEGKNYIIPADNPFVDDPDALDEIWAYGFRNPFRFSFDEDTGWLWAVDVGDQDWEEVNVVEAGLNYGWNIVEGNQCHNPPEDCDQTGLELPIFQYANDEGKVGEEALGLIG